MADRDWGNARATRVAVLAVITATVCWIAVMSEAPESPSSECWETVVPNLDLEVASANTIVSSLRLLVGCGALSEDAHARLRTLVAHRDPRVRAAVALTYAGQWSNDADATDALSLLAADSSAEVRGATVEALLRHGSNGLNILRGLLPSDDATVRGTAVVGIGEFIRRGWSPPIELTKIAAKDEDQRVRRAAVIALSTHSARM